MTATVRTERDESVLVVTICRPEVRNAVDGPTAEELYRVFCDFDQDDALSVAVLEGEGATFCAGADLKAVAAGRGNRIGRADDGVVGSLGPMGPTRLELTKPVIASIEGHAVAGGLELALWCDLRVMAEDAVLGVFCRRWGVPLVDGGTVRLPRLIGESNAMDLILTGRAVGSEESLRMGLANRVCAPGDARAAAVALAHEIAGFPQLCVRSDLASVRRQWDVGLDAALDYEVEVGVATVRSGETQAGAARFAAGEGRHGAF